MKTHRVILKGDAPVRYVPLLPHEVLEVVPPESGREVPTSRYERQLLAVTDGLFREGHRVQLSHQLVHLLEVLQSVWQFACNNKQTFVV